MMLSDHEKNGQNSEKGLREAAGEWRDLLISDFTIPAFQNAFQAYFDELGVRVSDWPALFDEMNRGGNEAYVRIAADGRAIGFIQFVRIRFSSWFFEEECGFIREFWVSKAFRSNGHGAALLRLAEERLYAQGIRTSILTTDTAEGFYLRCGYVRAEACRAKNKDKVYVKRLA